MSAALPSDPCVALVASNEMGIAELRPTWEMLDHFGVAWREVRWNAAESVAFDSKGLHAVIVASADANLPAAVSERTRLPVVRVPIPDGKTAGISLLQDAATANLPAGDGSFATVAIGEAGAKNAALFVISMLGLTDERLWAEWLAFRERQTAAVLALEPLTEH